MKQEEYKVLAEKAAAGDQDAFLQISQEAERLYAVEAAAAEEKKNLETERDKLKETNTKILISMFGRSDPGSPAGNRMQGQNPSTPPKFYDEDGFEMRGTSYAAMLAEQQMNAILDKEEANGN